MCYHLFDINKNKIIVNLISLKEGVLKNNFNMHLNIVIRLAQ